MKLTLTTASVLALTALAILPAAANAASANETATVSGTVQSENTPASVTKVYPDQFPILHLIGSISSLVIHSPCG